MKVVFLATVAALLVSAVSASEAEKKELIEKSKAFMDAYYKDVIKDIKDLKAKGKTYSANDANTLAAMYSVKEFTKRTAESTQLVELLNKLTKSGEVKDFKIYDQGSPELKKELDEAVKSLITPGSVSPRFIGALFMGGTQLSSDVVKMGLTRY